MIYYTTLYCTILYYTILYSRSHPDKLRRHHGPDAFGKSQRLSGKLSLESIQKQLNLQCWRNEKPHTCLDMLKSAASGVLRWRQLWFSLPKADRDARLRMMFARSYEASGHSDAFQMKYEMLGQKMCRQAFLQVTGISIDALQTARTAATTGVYTASAQTLGVWVSRRPATYMHARAWLLDYAKVHADTSPLNTNLWLPTGRKSFYWAQYYNDCVTRGVPTERVASLARFLLVWRTELPWVKIRSSYTYIYMYIV